jgi:hypothetical protein
MSMLYFSTKTSITSSTDLKHFLASHLVPSSTPKNLYHDHHNRPSLIERLKNHHNIGKQMIGKQLAATIGTFSTIKVNGLTVPVEVMDGL